MTYINETRARLIDDWLEGKISDTEMDRLSAPPISIGRIRNWKSILQKGYNRGL